MDLVIYFHLLHHLPFYYCCDDMAEDVGRPNEMNILNSFQRALKGIVNWYEQEKGDDGDEEKEVVPGKQFRRSSSHGI